MCDEKNRKWLLILDNVDDARFLYEAPSLNQERLGNAQIGISRQPLWAYLP
jgi:hypothetical protein